jgi:hypothetical protein
MWDVHIQKTDIELAFWKIKIKDIQKVNIKTFIAYDHVFIERINNSYLVLKTKRRKE